MKDFILREIQRIAKANLGQAPGVITFEAETSIRESAWRGIYWARWSDALKEAGLSPNEWQQKSDPELILKKYVEAARHYGQLPTASELKLFGRTQKDYPNSKTILGFFGSKQKLLANLRLWAQSKPELQDIAEMLGPELAQTTKSEITKEGLVYLIKSGAHYKIGRSDALERRIKEIRIALPETANLLHSIRTDDPAGIEAYWHRRFAERRANGEWFKLTSGDVSAFKRRKFQ